ncbi:flagellar protein FlgN [Pontibacillus marinus]|uniref:FlgN protein n=1 Tax=Pontibacillus marinus BH030004 = DSM 16465 TaxID=1385511 RepID=A0A0A5G6J5_9BACI|nr:flagellar protein FlgN [Pontibacillus marinus]KGX86793.1 hypothetical protein N783_11525 [Pontibacillus marinus BH030004 = DSM 16465]
MSTQPITEIMDKLCSLHQSLLTLSQEKTEALKKGNTEELQAIIVKERKHVQAIGQLETKREQLVSDWFASQGVNGDERTITAMLENINNEQEGQALQEQFERLVMILADLKQQEKLNQELTQQSLQFIDMSLDMIQPSMKNLNYGRPNAKQSDSGNRRSVFDSKA